MTYIIAMMSGRSAPGRIGTNLSDFAAIWVNVGSMQTTYVPCSIASATKCQSWICASVRLLPQRNMVLAFT